MMYAAGKDTVHGRTIQMTQEIASENTEEETNNQPSRRERPQERRIKVSNHSYDGEKRNISCWGDSMMYGCATTPGFIEKDGEVLNISYATTPGLLQNMTGYRTFNLGINGETSEEIATRAGGFLMYTDRDIKIEGSGTAIFKLINEFGENIRMEDYSGYNFMSRKTNICKILDQDYYVTNNEDDESQIIYGKDVFIPQGTPVYTAAAVERKDDILILEMGSNGGWYNDYDELIDQYDAILQYTGAKYYIIVGDTDEPVLSADENHGNIGMEDTPWEQALQAAYGDHFFNLRKYMIQNGLSDCGFTATDEDLEGYTHGNISQQLRSDWTHFNAYGYYAKAKGIYEKGRELGYWE